MVEILEKEKYTPMMRQYLTIKEDYKDELLFFRLGDFYELFFNDALIASKELEIQLTGRDAGVKEKVPMCGVPFHSVEPYIEKLVSLGYKIAICEQLTLPNQKEIVRREVTRVITPGANMNTSALENYKNNYIVSVYKNGNYFFLAYIDITTGEGNSLTIAKDYQLLINEILKLNTKEVVLSKNINLDLINNLFVANQITVNISNNYTLKANLKDLVIGLNQDEIKAYAMLTNYLIHTQKRELSHLQVVSSTKQDERISMDRFTVKNLELVETARSNEKKSSLFWYLDKTSTAFGSRFLRKEILSPLANKTEILKRQDIVGYLMEDFYLRDNLLALLSEIYDLERIIGRIGYGNVSPKDLDNLKKSINTFPKFLELKDSIKNDTLKELVSSIVDVVDLRELLNKAINDNPPLTIKEKNVIKDGYNERLDELRYIEKHQSEFLLELEQSEREKTGIKSLKIGYNRVYGYYFEILKSQSDLIKDEYGYIRKQTLTNAERYINSSLKEKENIILNAIDEQIKLEYVLYDEIKKEAVKYIKVIQKNAKNLALIDMLISLSRVAEAHDLVKPTLVDEDIIDIVDASHPVLATLMNDSYVKNDCKMDHVTKTLLITGPNMSGKSTYMRMIALIVVMAQIGSYVPCSSCKMKVFDKIFTRIGASDDLISGQSTFMVEMLEVNYALRNATKDSLILFDEIGRGTATYDGIALAQSILEYINREIGAKLLFATHYHELVGLENYLGSLKNIHVEAKEANGDIVFYHKIMDGAVDKSYGINVAGLADIPKAVIKRAKVILKELEQNNQAIDLFSTFNLEEEIEEEAPKKDTLREELEDLNVDEMTPIQALTYLNELVKRVKDENN